jgi:tetratricopeptide (TPR) repeat protein
VATAYYASSRLVAMMGERYGMKRMGVMLRKWGEGMDTKEVFQSALGIAPAVEDRRFEELMDRDLARYETQFVPRSRVGTVDAARAQVEAAPNDASRRTALSLALFRAGKKDEARRELDQALSLDEKNADARFLAARLALAAGQVADAVKRLRLMLSDKQDGYAVQMLLADASEATGDGATRLAALLDAARLDPTQPAPLLGLLSLAEAKQDAHRALVLLRQITALSEHDAGAHRELVTRLVARGAFAEAVAAGEAANHADITGFATHRAFAEALAKTGDKKRARFELESALLCDAAPEELAEARAALGALGGRAASP